MRNLNINKKNSWLENWPLNIIKQMFGILKEWCSYDSIVLCILSHGMQTRRAGMSSWGSRKGKSIHGKIPVRNKTKEQKGRKLVGYKRSLRDSRLFKCLETQEDKAAEQVKILALKPDNLSLTSGTHMVGAEAWFSQTVFWAPPVLWQATSYTLNKHTSKWINK